MQPFTRSLQWLSIDKIPSITFPDIVVGVGVVVFLGVVWGRSDNHQTAVWPELKLRIAGNGPTDAQQRQSKAACGR